MDMGRRAVVKSGWAAAGLAALSGVAGAQAFDPIPVVPNRLPPGKAGDFNFLAGEWRIRNRRLPTPGGQWEEFDGEATVTTILKGAGSVEDLRIPAKNFAGMGLRLLDQDRKVWTDFWVNARSGVLTTPGQTGGFVAGAGLFVSEDMEDGKKVMAIGVWDAIKPDSCRWRQATSRDGGKTWDQNWIMDWTRVRPR